MPLDLAIRARTQDKVTDLSVSGLTKSFGRAAPIFSGLEFQVSRGASVALVGANGTGKSTLLRCCLGLVAPDCGTVRLLGEDMTELSKARIRALRSRTGLVAQKHNLVPRLSVLTNVLHGLLGAHSGPRYWLQGLAPEKARQAGLEALAKVGLADLALRRADGLSGGQSQRVAIARALVSGPRFLVADEPCASLDPAAGEEVMALFFRLVRQEGVTVIFTSHQIEHALDYGERILGLRDGSLTLDASPGDLTRQDLRRLYD